MITKFIDMIIDRWTSNIAAKLIIEVEQLRNINCIVEANTLIYLASALNKADGKLK